MPTGTDARLEPADGANALSLERATAYLQTGAWCGLMAGVPAVVMIVASRLTGRLTFDPPESIWREPLGSVVSMTVVAAVFALGRRVWPRVFAWRHLLALGLALVVFAILLQAPRLHWAASAALAGGVGFQLGGMAARRPGGLVRLMRATLLPGLALVLLAAMALPGARYWRARRAFAPATNGDAPNVLFLVWDTVRSWSLSAYGYQRPTTPVLSELASRGVLFERAMSPAPWTLPSHAAMFTGRWPHEQSTDWFRPLDTRYPVLAEWLGDRGYLTAGFCANVRYCSEETGLARGFAHYEGYQIPARSLLLAGPLFQLAARISWVIGTPPDEDAAGKRRNATMMIDGFLSWLDGARRAGTGQPFFAFLNLFDTHRPYTSPPDLQAAFTTPGAPFTPNLQPHSGDRQAWDPVAIQGSMDAYDASIAYVDRELGRLLGELEGRGLLSNTIIVVTSDHGEEFAEHDLIGHGNSLYRASMMVPLVIVAPGRVPPRRVDRAVSTRDLPRTLVDLVGGDNGGTSFPGRSLASYWADSTGSDEPPVPVLGTLAHGYNLPAWYPVSHGPLRSVVVEPWRYVVRQDGTEELFDFESDSLERVNLVDAPEGRPVAARLRALLDSLSPPGEMRSK